MDSQTKSPIKIGASGEQLANDATDHQAILYADGVMHAVNAPGFDEEMTYAEAEAACASLNHAGFSDWRLPERVESLVLVDLKRYAPAADPALFPDMKSDWYWTRTPTAWSLNEDGSSRSVWFVSFYSGNVSYLGRDGRAFARPCRVAAPAGQ